MLPGEGIWMFAKMVGFPPKSSHFNRVFHYFHHPFWGKTHYFWKHPYIPWATLGGFSKFFPRRRTLFSPFFAETVSSAASLSHTFCCARRNAVEGVIPTEYGCD